MTLRRALPCLLLAACAAGENYHPPAPSVADRWNTAPTVSAPQKQMLPLMPWWAGFGDAALPELLHKALANNNDLKIAQARIREARANERAAFASLLPQIDASGNVTRQTVPVSVGKAKDTLAQAGARGAWAIDLFGGGRRRDEAAQAALEQALAQGDNARLLLLAEVAHNYVQWRSGQQQYLITVQNMDLQMETLEGTWEQRKEGDTTELEVARAQAQVGLTGARLPQIRTAMAAALNRLSTLTGEPVARLEPLIDAPAPIPAMPPQQVLATPLQAIASRPDVRAAERRLAETTALTGEATAQLLPHLNLEAFLGTQHSNLYAPLSPWNVALTGLMPILDFGRLRAQVDAADARQQQAFFQYQQTVLLALEEIENALAAYLNEQQRMDTLDNVAAEQARAVDVAREQYKAGLATQLDLLVAEGNKLDAESALAQSEAAVSDNLILLYRALGEQAQTQSAMPASDKSVDAGK